MNHKFWGWDSCRIRNCWSYDRQPQPPNLAWIVRIKCAYLSSSCARVGCASTKIELKIKKAVVHECIEVMTCFGLFLFQTIWPPWETANAMPCSNSSCCLQGSFFFFFFVFVLFFVLFRFLLFVFSNSKAKTTYSPFIIFVFITLGIDIPNGAQTDTKGVKPNWCWYTESNVEFE